MSRALSCRCPSLFPQFVSHARFINWTVYPRLKASRSSVVVNAAARKMWLPGSEAPAHLDCSLVGDFGFDPLGLGKDPKALAYYREAELVHARFAMAGVAGILVPSVLNHIGAADIAVWYKAGEVAQASSSINFGKCLTEARTE